jgi:hypothetical protein
MSTPVRITTPDLTHAMALFIKLMEQYSGLGYRLALLEAQKLAYFTQKEDVSAGAHRRCVETDRGRGIARNGQVTHVPIVR